MKFRTLALTLILTLVLVFGFTACGSATSQDFTENFIGPWTLTSIEGSDNSISADDIAFFSEVGYSTTLMLNEDGTASFDLFGDVTTGTWEAQKADAGTLMLNSEEINMLLSGDTLTLEQGSDGKFMFVRASESADTNTGANTTASTENTSEPASADAAAASEEAVDSVGEDAAEGDMAAGEGAAETTDENVEENAVAEETTEPAAEGEMTDESEGSEEAA